MLFLIPNITLLPSPISHKKIPADALVAGPVQPFTIFPYNKWFYHVLFWVIYYLFICLVFYSAYDIHDFGFYIQVGAFMPISAALVYFNLSVLIPAFFRRKKYLLYLLSLLLSLIIAALVDQLLKKFFARYGSPLFAISSDLHIRNLFTEAVGLFYLTGFTTSVKLSIDWIQNQRLMKEKKTNTWKQN